MVPKVDSRVIVSGDKRSLSRNHFHIVVRYSREISHRRRDWRIGNRREIQWGRFWRSWNCIGRDSQSLGYSSMMRILESEGLF